jgi:hypothetical protein
MALVAECTGAGVPPEVMEFVAPGRQVRPAHDVCVGRRPSVAVDDRHGVALLAGGVERRDIGELLRWRRNRGSGRSIEGGVLYLWHAGLLSSGAGRAMAATCNVTIPATS